MNAAISALAAKKSPGAAKNPVANFLRYVFLLFLLTVTGQMHASPLDGRDTPLPVNVDFFVFDLDGINDVEQSFIANVFLRVSWVDPELAHNEPGEVRKRLGDVWNPQFQVLNQQNVVLSFPEFVDISPEGEVTYLQRFWGSYSQALSLVDFPFDQQILTFQLASIGFEREELDIHIHPLSGVGDGFSIPDWVVTGHEIGPLTAVSGVRGPGLAGIELKIMADRRDGYYLVKIVLPMIMIVLMSMLVFWIDPEQSGTQIGVGTTAMLTLISYRFAVGDALPKLSFLTRMDYFILMSTVLVFTSLLMVIWTSSLARQGKTVQARKIDSRARWIMPSLFAFFTFETLYLGLFI